MMVWPGSTPGTNLTVQRHSSGMTNHARGTLLVSPLPPPRQFLSTPGPTPILSTSSSSAGAVAEPRRSVRLHTLSQSELKTRLRLKPRASASSRVALSHIAPSILSKHALTTDSSDHEGPIPHVWLDGEGFLSNCAKSHGSSNLPKSLDPYPYPLTVHPLLYLPTR
ncbi:hypothetical protein K439DRAFT_980300 [Ramaria rubella]|nr:hypothetical protein K439DRAFT_980300 [Ramaria rubella]